MSVTNINPERLRAILFDYGSTLVEFSQRQVDLCGQALAEALSERYGPVDSSRLAAMREADRLAPYQDGYRENSVPAITRRLIRALYNLEPSDQDVSEICRIRFAAFVDSIAPPGPEVVKLLSRLRQRYRLGLVSNYPEGRALRASLDRVELKDCFDTVVVSGDVGFVKPHPAPFRAALADLDIDPASAAYVGDNWLADIQGAKKLGMQAIWTRQFASPESFKPQPGDLEPDVEIACLADLETVF
jgi:putative hydrolase of the HAD superfamily